MQGVPGQYFLDTSQFQNQPVDGVLHVPHGRRGAFPVYEGPQFFKRIDRFQKEVTADFVLEPRLTPAEHHTLLVQGDPQIKNYGVDGSAEAYRSVVIPDMIRMRSTIGTPCYGINLGDLVYNDMNVLSLIHI